MSLINVKNKQGYIHVQILEKKTFEKNSLDLGPFQLTFNLPLVTVTNLVFYSIVVKYLNSLDINVITDNHNFI